MDTGELQKGSEGRTILISKDNTAGCSKGPKRSGRLPKALTSHDILPTNTYGSLFSKMDSSTVSTGTAVAPYGKRRDKRDVDPTELTERGKGPEQAVYKACNQLEKNSTGVILPKS